MSSEADRLAWLHFWGTYYLKHSTAPEAGPNTDAGERFSEKERAALAVAGALAEEAGAETAVVRADEYLGIPPQHVIAFAVDTAGAETAIFGLATHPSTIEHVENGRTLLLPTGLGPEYRWRAACKTQYASVPEHGGIENFLRAHVSLVQLLDAAVGLGIEVQVYDDTEYWQKRDRQAALKRLGYYNNLIAAVVGSFKDAIGDEPGKIVAPITEHPDFEHMEARGQEQLCRPR